MLGKQFEHFNTLQLGGKKFRNRCLERITRVSGFISQLTLKGAIQIILVILFFKFFKVNQSFFKGVFSYFYKSSNSSILYVSIFARFKILFSISLESFQ